MADASQLNAPAQAAGRCSGTRAAHLLQRTTHPPAARVQAEDAAQLQQPSDSTALVLPGDGTATGSSVVGLNNLGNTCFFNSSLQLLLACAPLQQMLLQQDHQLTKGPMGYALQQAAMFASGEAQLAAQLLGRSWVHASLHITSLLVRMHTC